MTFAPEAVWRPPSGQRSTACLPHPMGCSQPAAAKTTLIGRSRGPYGFLMVGCTGDRPLAQVVGNIYIYIYTYIYTYTYIYIYIYHIDDGRREDGPR